MSLRLSSRSLRLSPNPQRPIMPWLLAGGLLILLLILATLQFRWLDEVSQADRRKSADLLQTAVTRFAEDFDRELTRAFLYLLPPHAMWAPPWQNNSQESFDQSFAQRYERWQTYAPFPDLVRDVYRIQRGEGGEFEATRFAPNTGHFEPTPWPSELEPLKERLSSEQRWSRRRGRSRDSQDRIRLVADDIPALILPMSSGGPPGRSFGPGPPEDRRGMMRPESRSGLGPGLMVLLLDLETIRTVILPELSERHLHSVGSTAGRAYDTTIFASNDQRIIFHRGTPLVDESLPEGDATASLFGLLPLDKLGTLELEAGLRHRESQAGESESGSGASRDGPRERRSRGGHLHRIYRFISGEEGAGWRLVASHPEGSLDAAVGKAHRRNLAISFGILLLLAGSLMLMLFSTRRIQALARQQLEFIAGVTHELLTPLAAMRSAGQNLADGVVAEPQQVQRYGRLVEDEGRRLSTMVEQVLEFAGMQAGRRSYALTRTRLTPIVEGALAEYSGVLEEKGVRVDESLDDGQLEVMADAAALRRAVQNLIANAIKYGGEGGSIHVRVATHDGRGGHELQISVEDQGPGIAAADLPRLFEPFYRGGNGSPQDLGIPGSGLGLSLVKHIVEGHGGQVTVASEEGKGSKFTLHLPVADGPINHEENDEL